MTTDLLARIAELAGYKVAATIAEEFGGAQVYVRRNAAKPATYVRCSGCLLPSQESNGFYKCPQRGTYVGYGNQRKCEHFIAKQPLATVDAWRLEAIAKIKNRTTDTATAGVVATTSGGSFIEHPMPRPELYPRQTICLHANTGFVCPTPEGATRNDTP